MILVTVGTHNQGFNRLVRAADELAATLEEEIIIQYGSATYEPHHAHGFRFTSSAEMAELMSRARLIICHAAAGTILSSLKGRKKLVVVPRRKKFQEIFDDHQFQLACALEKSGQAVAVFDPNAETLAAALLQAEQNVFKPDCSATLRAAVKDLLQAWDKNMTDRSQP